MTGALCFRRVLQCVRAKGAKRREGKKKKKDSLSVTIKLWGRGCRHTEGGGHNQKNKKSIQRYESQKNTRVSRRRPEDAAKLEKHE